MGKVIHIDSLTESMDKLQRYEIAKRHAFGNILARIQVLGHYQTIGDLNGVEDELKEESASIIENFLTRISAAIFEQKGAFKNFPRIVYLLDEQLKLILEIKKLVKSYQGIVGHYIENPVKSKTEVIVDLNEVYSRIYTAMQSFLTLSHNIVNRKNFEEKKADYLAAA